MIKKSREKNSKILHLQILKIGCACTYLNLSIINKYVTFVEDVNHSEKFSNQMIHKSRHFQNAETH